MISWRTTIGGILAAAGQFIEPILPPHLGWVGSALTGLGVLIMGSSARDNQVTSEEAGLK